MRTIYSGLQYENYDPRRGTSFEYNNFYLSLKNLAGVEMVDYFFDRIVVVGKRQFNENLVKLVEQERPEYLFVFMYTDEITTQTLSKIQNSKFKITSIAWMSDDHWRLHDYSRHYAPYFDWVVTTHSKAPEKYARYGITNVIRSQWACNTAIWKPQFEIQRDIDVSFVGQRTAARAKIIDALRQAGINVCVRGFGWPEGRVSQQELMEIISRSKVNLNLNPPLSPFNLNRLSRLFFRRVTGAPGLFSRLALRLKGSRSEWGRIIFSPRLISNIRSWYGLGIPQIKARPFELLGCSAFVISGYADDMNRYYEDDREIVYYDGSDTDLINKVRYYLNHEEKRERIARAGYERTVREHTYQKRFEEIFRRILNSESRIPH